MGNVLTLINHGTEPQVVAVAGVDLVSGEAVSGVRLESFGWALVRP